jgi:Tol biopolymer transport system component
MSELREVFEMVTKQTEPDVDAWREQEKHQRRSSRNKRIGAFAVAAAIGLVVVFVLVNRTEPSTNTPAANPSPSPLPEFSVPSLVDLQTGGATPLPESILGGYLHGAGRVSSWAHAYFTSPDRTMFVFTPCCGLLNPVSVANVDGTGVRQITPDGTEGFGARWSPDGSMLVYQQRDGATKEIGNLFVVDVATGEATQITDLDPEHYGMWFLSPSFSPDGQTIIFHMPRGPAQAAGQGPAQMNDDVSTRWDLWSVPVAGGEPTLVVHNASMGVYAPDGGTLAYLDSPRGWDWTSSRLMVADVDGSDPRLLVQGDEVNFPRWSPDGTRIAYTDADGIHIVDVSTGEATLVAEGASSDWFGDDTLVVVP